MGAPRPGANLGPGGGIVPTANSVKFAQVRGRDNVVQYCQDRPKEAAKVLVLFVDESGTHSLAPIEPEYPIFVLAGCLLLETYHDRVIVPRMRRYNQGLWGRDDVILHTRDIVGMTNGFENLADPAEWNKFLRETNALMLELDYKVVACVIRKHAHKEKYGDRAFNPYYFSLEVLAERLIFEHRHIHELVPARIVAESRGDVLDARLRKAWERIRAEGTSYVRAKEIRERIESELHFHVKSDNICGLQMADLVASPIGRRVLGRSSREDWEIVRQKLRAPGGTYMGYGLKILP